jgi:transcription antitermination factor NusG
LAVPRKSNPRMSRGTPRVRAADEPKSPPTIERGTHVRALAGSFAGQAGVVQELDGKGGARVLFGRFAARVELGDLAVHSSKRGRPVMSSSHRKPST